MESLNPPTREGESAFLLFDWLGDASSFRRQVQKVTRARSNDLRGEIVDVMKIRAAEFTIHPDAIQFSQGRLNKFKRSTTRLKLGLASHHCRIEFCAAGMEWRASGFSEGVWPTKTQTQTQTQTQAQTQRQTETQGHKDTEAQIHSNTHTRTHAHTLWNDTN